MDLCSRSPGKMHTWFVNCRVYESLGPKTDTGLKKFQNIYLFLDINFIEDYPMKLDVLVVCRTFSRTFPNITLYHPLFDQPADLSMFHHLF